MDSSSRADMARCNATVSANKAAVENLGRAVDFATIKAPISGAYSALAVHEGTLVRANDQSRS